MHVYNISIDILYINICQLVLFFSLNIKILRVDYKYNCI